MQNVVLIILLLLAAALIAVVLLQRSEGGGLGIGGGSGGGIQARGQGNALTRLTWILGTAFMAAALALTLISAQNAGSSSVLDGGDALLPPGEAETTVPAGEDLLPPSLDDEEPLLPVAE
ncbi:MAG: preprotein translocase subunit SecG [Pseudomonadota bacterium]